MAYILGTATSVGFRVINTGTTGNPSFLILWNRFPPAKENQFYNSLGLYLQRSYTTNDKTVASANGTIPAYVVSGSTPVAQTGWTTIKTWNAAETAALSPAPPGWVTFTDSLAAGTGLVAGQSTYNYRLIYFATQISTSDHYEVDYPPIATPVNVSPGAAVWAKNFGGNSYNYGQVVVIHPTTGDIIVAGYFGGTTDFGTGTPLTALGQQDMFLARYTSAGVAKWSVRFGGAGGNITPNTIGLDSVGNIIVAGGYRGTVNFGGSNHTCTSTGLDAWIAQYNSSGVHIWDKVYGITPLPNDLQTDDIFNSMAIDSDDNVILTGVFSSRCLWDQQGVQQGGANFGQTGFNSNYCSYYGNQSIVIAKYAGSDGSYIWSNAWVTQGQSRGLGITIDSNKDAYIVGLLNGTMTFPDATVLTGPQAGYGAFAVKIIGSTGLYVWKSVWFTNTYDVIAHAARVSGDRLIIAGYYKSASINFGGFPSIIVNNSHVGQGQTFIVNLLKDTGVPKWAVTSQSETAQGTVQVTAKVMLDIGPGGNIYSSGTFAGTQSFDGRRLTSIDFNDAYVVAYTPDGNLLWATSFAGTTAGASSQSGSIDVDSSGPVIVGFFYNGSVNFSGITLTKHSTYDVFVVRLTL